MHLIVFLAVIAILTFALFEFTATGTTGARRWPVAAKQLLTEQERRLFQRLTTAFPVCVVLTQVALSQHVTVERGAKNRVSIQNRFFRLVADFVICRRDVSVIADIELDDSTHGRAIRRRSDAQKTKALEDAGLRLIRLRASAIPSVEDSREMLSTDAAA